MTSPTIEDNKNLAKVREWTDTFGHTLNTEGTYKYPYPSEYVEYEISGRMREDIFKRLDRISFEDDRVTLVQGKVYGGYSEVTQEHDYPIEVWVYEPGESPELVFSDGGTSRGSLAEFLNWIEEAF